MDLSIYKTRERQLSDFLYHCLGLKGSEMSHTPKQYIGVIGESARPAIPHLPSTPWEPWSHLGALPPPCYFRNHTCSSTLQRKAVDPSWATECICGAETASSSVCLWGCGWQVGAPGDPSLEGGYGTPLCRPVSGAAHFSHYSGTRRMCTEFTQTEQYSQTDGNQPTQTTLSHYILKQHPSLEYEIYCALLLLTRTERRASALFSTLALWLLKLAVSVLRDGRVLGDVGKIKYL